MFDLGLSTVHSLLAASGDRKYDRTFKLLADS